MNKFSKKTVVLFILLAILLTFSAIVSIAAVNTLEHNSNYDVTDYVYDNLDDFTDTHHYYHDQSMDPGKGDNKSDSVVGTLDGDKVIDLYYGYDNVINIKYYDAYTKAELTGNDYLADKSGYTITQEHTTSYDITSKIGKVYGDYSFVKSVEYSVSGGAASGSLMSDMDVSVYLGKSHTITVNYHDTFTGDAIKESYVASDVEYGSAYDLSDKKLLNIVNKSVEYKLDYVNVNGITKNDYGFTGNLEDNNLVIDIYYYYTHKVTIKFVDKYTSYVLSNYTLVFDENTSGFSSRHGSDYDVSSFVDEDTVLARVIKGESGKYDFIDSITGTAKGKLDGDKEIVVVLGYYHKVTIRYRDKYTGEIIHTEEISVDEAGSMYNMVYASAPNIVYAETLYNYDGKEGDDLEGVLDDDKETTLYYGYNNQITVLYKDTETETEIRNKDVEVLEHLSDYEATDKTGYEIEGYTSLSKVTGDDISGSLDEDKEITVWYAKTDKKTSPETSDNNIRKIILAGALSLIVIMLLITLFVSEAAKKKRNIL